MWKKLITYLRYFWAFLKSWLYWIPQETIWWFFLIPVPSIFVGFMYAVYGWRWQYGVVLLIFTLISLKTTPRR